MSIGSRFHAEDGKINRSLWFVVIMVALLGAVLIDGASIVYTRMQLEQVAADVASEASSAIQRGAGDAKELAIGQIEDPNIRFIEDDYEVDKETGNVTIALQQTAGTVFVKMIPQLEHLAVITVTKTAGPSKV